MKIPFQNFCGRRIYELQARLNIMYLYMSEQDKLVNKCRNIKKREKSNSVFF